MFLYTLSSLPCLRQVFKSIGSINRFSSYGRFQPFLLCLPKIHVCSSSSVTKTTTELKQKEKEGSKVKQLAGEWVNSRVEWEFGGSHKQTKSKEVRRVSRGRVRGGGGSLKRGECVFVCPALWKRCMFFCLSHGSIPEQRGGRKRDCRCDGTGLGGWVRNFRRGWGGCCV